jgi:hypothetical protein
MNNCPICSAEIKDDERLVAYLYKPQGWWVVCHDIPVTDDRLKQPGYAPYPLEQEPMWHRWCQQAGFKLQ